MIMFARSSGFFGVGISSSQRCVEHDERLGAILAKLNPYLSMDLFTQFFVHRPHCLRLTHIYITQIISALPDTLATYFLSIRDSEAR
jgi:hypothetical protein